MAAISSGMAAILLAGGGAKRMGGGVKGLASVGGASILARALATLTFHCAPVLLNAPLEAGLAALELPIVEDTIPGRAGPLAGVLAGLEWLRAHRPDLPLLLSAPCDAPFLPADLAPRLLLARAGAEIACAASGGQLHPTAALWPVALAGDLREFLEGGGRRMTDFLAGRRVGVMEWPTAPHDPFFNVNTPEDLAAARAMAGE